MRKREYFVHLTYIGVVKSGPREYEPEQRHPGAVVGYGPTMEAAYTAARRAMLERFRLREQAAYDHRYNAWRENFAKSKERKDEAQKELQPVAGGED